MEEALDSYDLSYYRNLVEEKNYSVDQLLIQEYFPFEHVLKTLLELYESILGLKFTRVTDQPVWHEDVVCLAVNDAADGHFIGYCYMDMFPRDGKYSHAALFPLQPNVVYNGKRSYGVCSLVCNFTKSTPKKPSLLTHDEVVTFFHEFGHCMHHICAENVKFAEFAGTSVEQDFVECPSQMLENWCWEKDILKRLSRHYKTQEPLPDDLIEKLIKSRDANEGINTQRQLVFDNFDQSIHGVAPPSDITSTFNDISLQTMGVRQQEGSHFPATFGHMCGYDAKYYSYLWAEVFADDLFLSKFKKPNNLLNPETGMEYRRTILSRGGAVDASEMLKEFLGREPNQDAFLEMKGLKA
ncbi:Thimet oligopeptidase, putative [Perkinsus marinus ATCC 50983]|uniref:Thimet oligopeptidase, putative n=1 Tax=Perkinsus marinus (strain ATCC 50983 / TXsc) TaxID=423536 RepID=C5L1D9_PERM5|nr:Thimet oligopeptidase, putative [Perkinsus marinus ATCC 50983]EER09454.1 Thimet oligopeptidase, putative [Perkinsus marinus ATCC 50983]|eukprot:XP_002777638.1 Thimet oligopeptidase, putative [Perkinsus marinus ATCC 50983]